MVFIASLILNFFLIALIGHRLWVLYRGAKLRRAQRYSRRNSHFALRPVAPTDVVFLGDSITEGCEWSALFPDRVDNIRNFGIGSDTTIGVLERLVPTVDGQPHAVFLMIGTNDIGLRVPQTQSWKSYKMIVDKICTSSPETDLYIQSILPRKAEEQPQVAKFNDYLKSLAHARKVRYMDLQSDFADASGGIDVRLSNDHLHLLGPGYRLWQSLLGGHLGSE